MANTYNGTGLTAATFGISGLYTGYVVQAVNTTSKNGVEAKVLNELGQEVVRRYDDLMTEVTLDMILNGGALPVPGATLTYPSPGGTVYEVVSLDVKNSNKDFAKISVKVKNSANITS